MPRGLSAQGDLQAAGRRHRADRPEPLPRVQEVRGAVSVQEADVPGHDPGVGEVHCLLSADRGQGSADGRRADGNALYGGLRGQDPHAEPGAHRRRRPVGGGQVALPLYPQWGTEPNGFYIPPRHSPRGYARQMFGPGVDNAIEKYLVPSRELLAVLQLWRASQQIVFRYDVIPGPKVFETQIHGKRFEMYNDTVLGFNKSGKEVARIQVEEPIYVRPAERVNWL